MALPRPFSNDVADFLAWEEIKFEPDIFFVRVFFRWHHGFIEAVFDVPAALNEMGIDAPAVPLVGGAQDPYPVRIRGRPVLHHSSHAILSTITLWLLTTLIDPFGCPIVMALHSHPL